MSSEGLVVLLVDDDRMTGAVVRGMLAKESGVVLHHCTDPHRAIETALTTHPTVILQDIVMPGIDGFELLARYRGTPELEGVPVIMLSASEDPRGKSRAFASGASDYMVKLPDPLELVARVQAHARSYLVQRERDAAYRALEALKLQLEEKNQVLERLSWLDGLTGVANRRRFDQTIDSEWRRATRTGGTMGVIMVDVDFFKRFNDHLGHQQGDQCLIEVAGALAAPLRRPGDLLARYGGEEFIVLLPETSEEGACAMAEQLRRGVEVLGIAHPTSDVAPHVTISLGVATGRAVSDDDPASLVGRADAALYEAKSLGRNRSRLHRGGRWDAPTRSRSHRASA